jgi:hypothetical protein
MLDAAATSEETGNAPADAEDLATFDYAEPADLFTRGEAAALIAAGTSHADSNRARSRSTSRNALTYRRFGSGAEAIRHAIEKLPPRLLASTVLVVNGDRHEAAAIQALYASPAFPLVRKAARNI